MNAAFLTLLLILAPSQAMNQVSDAQKQEFLELLKTLPTQGEFYTDEAATKAAPYLPVLFALTEKDIEKYDIYPFIAISRGLFDQSESRDYAISHFPTIKHPQLKLFWGAMLFDSGAASHEIKQFLREALASKEQSRLLSEMMGPKFESFTKRVLSN